MQKSSQQVARLIRRGEFFSFAVGKRASKQNFVNPVDAAAAAVKTVAEHPHIFVSLPADVQESLFVVWHIEGAQMYESAQPGQIWNPWQRQGYEERARFHGRTRAWGG